MKTQSILRLACRVIKLNMKVTKQLAQGADPVNLKKDFDQLEVHTRRLLEVLKAKLAEERHKSGTTAAHSPAPAVR